MLCAGALQKSPRERRDNFSWRRTVYAPQPMREHGTSMTGYCCQTIKDTYHGSTRLSWQKRVEIFRSVFLLISFLPVLFPCRLAANPRYVLPSSENSGRDLLELRSRVMKLRARSSSSSSAKDGVDPTAAAAAVAAGAVSPTKASEEVRLFLIWWVHTAARSRSCSNHHVPSVWCCLHLVRSVL